MKSEHRSVLAIVLSVAFFVLWFYVINPAQKDTAGTAGAPAAATTQAASSVPAVSAPAQTTGAQAAKPEEPKVKDPQGSLPVKFWTLKNELVEVDITSDGAVPVSWRMLGYTEGTEKTSPLIDLAKVEAGTEPPLLVSFGDADFAFPARPRFEIVSADEQSAFFRWRSQDVEVTKKLTLAKGNYTADVEISVKNLKNDAIKGKPSLVWADSSEPKKKKGGFFAFLQPQPSDDPVIVMDLDGKVRRDADVSKLVQYAREAATVYWAGVENRYFLSAIIPRVQGSGIFVLPAVVHPTAERNSLDLDVSVSLPMMTVPAGDTATALYTVYVGPKEISLLKAVGSQLEGAIDYGFFSIVAVPILYCLKFFYSIIHNYGVAIILLTIFVKLLLHPINVKSLKSMKAMQQLQPRLKELQKKYKDDKTRLNQETMQLFKAHKVNPMGGCLPMLAQLPIYIALYKVLWNSIELYHAPFFWFYRDLSAPDPYLITPILLGLFMVAQQKLMPSTSADPAQQKMMMLMPIMFSVFMLFLPVGLVVYILVNTVMSVTQQYMYNHGIGFMDVMKGKFRPVKT